jgi:hypothetical protein
MEAAMWDKKRVVFSDNDAVELAYMYKVAVEKGFADGEGADSLRMSRAEIHRLYEKAIKLVEGPKSCQKVNLDEYLNKPGMPRLPKKHPWD